MNITITLPNSVPSPNFDGWRCKHKGEPNGYDKTPNGMPEVRPSFNAPAVPFTSALQRLSFDLLTYFNPQMTGDDWRYVYGWNIAFTNDNGFDRDGDPRADYVNNRDIAYPLPQLMKAIICGGAFVRGEVRGAELVCKPGIHVADANNLPTLATLLTKGWYYFAVDWFEKPSPHVYDFARGKGGRVAIPYVLSTEVTYPLEWFDNWRGNDLPNHLRYYA